MSTLPGSRQNGTYTYNGRPGTGLEYHDHNTTWNGKPISSMSWDDAQEALAQINANRAAEGRTRSRYDKDERKINDRITELYPQRIMDQMAEYQAMIGESLSALGEYMNLAVDALEISNEQPAQEPLKNALDSTSGAVEDTEAAQIRRRGLASTFTRYGSGGQKLGV